MILQKKTEAFVESGVDGEHILVNIQSGEFHAISGVALDVWHAIDGTRTLDGIHAILAARYAVERTTCEIEVAAFVDELRAAGLVDVA